MGGAGNSTYFLTVFLEMLSCLAMPLRGTPCSLVCCICQPKLTALTYLIVNSCQPPTTGIA